MRLALEVCSAWVSFCLLVVDAFGTASPLPSRVLVDLPKYCARVSLVPPLESAEAAPLTGDADDKRCCDFEGCNSMLWE